MRYHYRHVCLGGTFDHLHAGHKRILDFAFHTGLKVSIGISTDQFIQKKILSQSIQSFHLRKEYLTDYLIQNGWKERAVIFPLNDIYGTADTDNTLQAIIVTRETSENALKINKRRKKNSLLPLDIVSVPFLKGTDNKIVRAERIRKGAINRLGNSYLQLFTKTRQLNLPPRLRELLRKPLGTIIEGEERFASFTAEKAVRAIQKHHPVVTILVGDIVSDSLLAAGFKPQLIIRDNRSRRKDLPIIQRSKNAITNPPGTIKQTTVKAIHQAISDIEDSGMKTIIIKGEEDLLALPAILLSPLNSVVVYGQADMGIILIAVTEEKKEQIAGIIKQFE
ncbi:pantetheine-phosphate adenylyltransferase [Candidatus Roizmanbacteria bacterium]|nr:MAG: pantetheine-phosphate adenylyltransferase [Candidatus Roizmanbacteria bacterium]